MMNVLLLWVTGASRLAIPVPLWEKQTK